MNRYASDSSILPLSESTRSNKKLCRNEHTHEHRHRLHRGLPQRRQWLVPHLAIRQRFLEQVLVLGRPFHRHQRRFIIPGGNVGGLPYGEMDEACVEAGVHARGAVLNLPVGG